MILVCAFPARALDAVSVRGDAPAIDLTGVLEHQRSDADRIQVSTAPGTDGIVRRIEVRAREGGQNWVVFALANNTDDQLDRLIVAPHYRIVSSGLLGPTSGCPASRPSRPRPATGRSGRRARPPTSSASPSIPAPSSPSSRSCAPTSCRSSICGSRNPTRTRSTRSRCTRAS